MIEGERWMIFIWSVCFPLARYSILLKSMDVARIGNNETYNL